MLRASGLIHNGCNSFPFSAQAIPSEDIAWARSQPLVQEYVAELALVSRGRGYWQDPDPNLVNISPRLGAILGKEKVQGDSGSAVSEGVLDCSLPGTREAVRLDPSVQLISLAFDGGMALADASIAGFASTGMAFQDDTALSMPLSLASTMYQTEKVTALAIFLKDEHEIEPFLLELRSHLEGNRIPAEAYPFYDEKISSFYVGGMQFNWVMLYLFIGLVCTVVAISISNSLYITLLERKSELGTLRSIGFQENVIVRLLLLEAIFLLIFSFLPGVALTEVVRLAVNAAQVKFLIPGLSGEIPFRLHITAGFFLLLISILSALVLLVTRSGSKRFLRKSILDLLGAAS